MDGGLAAKATGNLVGVQFDAPIAFAATVGSPPALEIRVNFGILAGREATPAEIDDLARVLTEVVPDAAIVSEQHYEVGHGREATVHQVRVEIADDALPSDEAELDAVTRRLVDVAGRWAEGCAAERHAEL